MNRVELEHIEKRLGIKLPAQYKKLVAPLPVAGDRGGASGSLWDDSEKIIDFNAYLRQEHGWPDHYYCVGEDGAGGQFVIDLREAGQEMLRSEYENLSTLKPVTVDAAGAPVSLEDWYESYIRSRVGLDAPPPPPEPEASSSSTYPILNLLYRVVFVICAGAIITLLGIGLAAVVFTLMSITVDLLPTLIIAGCAVLVSGPILMALNRLRKR